ncbi:hypothetical protein ACJX0J_033865, partial [Zea mays]
GRRPSSTTVTGLDDWTKAERSSKLDCRCVGPRDECIEYSSAAPKLEARAPLAGVGGAPSTMAKKSVWLKLEPCGLCCRDELIEYISAPVRLDGSGVAISSNRCDADNKRTVTWSLPSSATSASISARPPYSGNSFGSTCSDAMAAMVSRNWREHAASPARTTSFYSVSAARNRRFMAYGSLVEMKWKDLNQVMAQRLWSEYVQ